MDEFIQQESKNYNVRFLCKILKVSKSGYYKHLKHKPTADLENKTLKDLIFNRFNEHKSRYGARRIKFCLSNRGVVVSKKRITRLMRQMGIKAIVISLNIKRINPY